MSNEYTQISAFLRQDQIDSLDEWARRKGIHGRQPLLRWAVDHYIAFLLSESSTYRTDTTDRPDTTADLASTN